MRKYLSILLALFFYACNAQPKTSLAVPEFEKGMQQDSAQLLDVRTVDEYNGGHIKNALWADWNNDKEFARRISFLNKKKPLYVYCLSGGRSAAAASMLRKSGFENVYELSGGISAWKASNKLTEGKSTAKQMTTDEYNKAITSNKTVLVDFGASWCPPCKVMIPIIDKVQKANTQNVTLFNVDAGKDDEILKLYKVSTLPVFIIYKNGIEVWRKVGIATENELNQALK